MADHDAFAHDLAALLRGARSSTCLRAEGPGPRRGCDAWLHDLVTADVAGLTPGASCRSLLLTPTGRIRADVRSCAATTTSCSRRSRSSPTTSACCSGPTSCRRPSRSRTRPASSPCSPSPTPPRRRSAPGIRALEPRTGTGPSRPQGKPAWRVQDALVKAALVEASAASAEAWRIIHGIARMGPDFDQRSLPSEAGLDDTIDTTKGCFLGQESVARIANLGHPPRVLRHVRCVAQFVPGARCSPTAKPSARSRARRPSATRALASCGSHGRRSAPI